jgi:hypothetical protein
MEGFDYYNKVRGWRVVLLAVLLPAAGIERTVRDQTLIRLASPYRSINLSPQPGLWGGSGSRVPEADASGYETFIPLGFWERDNV